MKYRNERVLVVFFAVWWAAISPASSAQQSPSAAEYAAYKDTKLSTEQRVNDLVSRMTLEEKVSQIGHTADGVPRLGIPEYNWWNEGLHGVARAGYATVFPQAIGLAATFDEPLIHQVAEVISTEFRPSTTPNCTKTGPARGTAGSPFGRRTSTFFAIRAGAAARRHTEKIPT
jgi:hypothetical protein